VQSREPWAPHRLEAGKVDLRPHLVADDGDAHVARPVVLLTCALRGIVETDERQDP
jgi:hypothetical protein